MVRIRPDTPAELEEIIKTVCRHPDPDLVIEYGVVGVQIPFISFSVIFFLFLFRVELLRKILPGNIVLFQNVLYGFLDS